MNKFKEEWIHQAYLTSEIDMLYHEVAVKLGVSDSILNILYIMCVVGDRCTQIEICRLSGISRQTINSAIHKLQKEGIIYLEPGDGRSTLVCLTDKGRQLIEEKAYPLIKMEQEIFNGWDKEERETYLRLMQRFRDEMKEKVSKL